MMRNRTFWAGFGVAVLVILLPVLFLIDARSSVDHQIGDQKRKSPPERTPAPLEGDGEGAEGGLLIPPSEAPLKSKMQPPLSPTEALHSGGTVLSKIDLRHPEIVFSPERVQKSVANDPRRRTSGRRPPLRHTGIRTIVYDPSHVYTVRAAVSHVTLIDLPEEAKEVYLGDSKLFLAEVFGSRVKIKPITWDPTITTNMIVYTLHRQFAFRLEVVREGEEDDLLTFYLPKSGTVVNLNPLRKTLEKDLAVREKTDLREQAMVTLRSAGASEPVGVWTEKAGVRAEFLGFSRLEKERYALFEIENETDHPLTLTGIRLRLFRSSLFWEGSREWVDGEDFSRGFRVVVPPHGKERALLLADPPPLSSAREGYLAEIRLDRDPGGRELLEVEARGGGR